MYIDLDQDDKSYAEPGKDRILIIDDTPYSQRAIIEFIRLKYSFFNTFTQTFVASKEVLMPPNRKDVPPTRGYVSTDYLAADAQTAREIIDNHDEISVYFVDTALPETPNGRGGIGSSTGIDLMTELIAKGKIVIAISRTPDDPPLPKGVKDFRGYSKREDVDAIHKAILES